MCCGPIGLLPSSFQGCPLHPPALVLHHHIQRRQAPHEGQAPGESKLNFQSLLKNAIIWAFFKHSQTGQSNMVTEDEWHRETGKDWQMNPSESNPGPCLFGAAP